MARTTKKGAKKTKAKPRRAAGKPPPAKAGETIAGLRRELADSLERENASAVENVRLDHELQARDRALSQALDQQAATGEILAVISGSPTNVQPVFDTIAESSMRLCGALFSSVYRFDGELIYMVAERNYPLLALEHSKRLFSGTAEPRNIHWPRIPGASGHQCS